MINCFSTWALRILLFQQTSIEYIQLSINVDENADKLCINISITAGTGKKFQMVTLP